MAAEIKFQDKTARVILVDSSGAVRQLLSEVAKSVGFTNTQSVATISDAHNILETEEADWLIVPLSVDQPISGLHTVRMTSSFPELRNVRVSLLMDETEQWCLPKAFECGLLSYHLKPFTKDSLTNDLQKLLQKFEKNAWESTKTSADYLRKSLYELKLGADLLQFERNILDVFPGDASQLINLAHAQHLAGLTDSAKTTLKQASFIDPALAPAIDEKANALFGSTDLTTTPSVNGEVGANVLGLSSVVIVDSDDSTRTTTRKILEELGVAGIVDFSDGEAAWEAIDVGPEPGLIIMEWRIPKLTGPLLMQRIRSKGFLRSPVVIQSSLIKPSDMSIVKEMGVSNIIEKPAKKQDFLKAIIWTIQQDRLPTEQQTMEIKIRSMIGMKNTTEAEILAVKYLADDKISEGRKNVIRAEIAFSKEKYEASRDFGIESLKGSGESIFALNILGKSLMVLRQFEAALKCFQKAQSMSPLNLERLVMIAESQAEVGESEVAKDTIAKAKDIDPESPIVQEGEVRVAVSSGDSDSAKKMLGQIEGVGNVISYLNNKAVAHAKCGLNDEGIDIYKKTLNAVPDDRVDTRAVVIYNMALAKIRRNDLADALVDLEEIIKHSETKVTKKAQSLKKRLEAAVGSNTGIALREADQNSHQQMSSTPESPTHDESQAADETTIVSTVVQSSPGEQCCYLVFRSSAEVQEPLKKLLSTPPRFKMRKPIERGETFMGADANRGGKAS